MGLRKMKCEEIKKMLVAYLDGEVTPEERSLIELHLSTCQECREELKALKNIQVELCQALNMEADEVSPSPELWEKLQRRLENTTSPSFWERYGAWLNRPLWRAVVPIVLVVMVFGALWGTGVLSGFRSGMAPPPAAAPAPNVTVPASTPASTTAVPRPTPAPIVVPGITQPPGPTITVEVSASTEKDSYLPGEAINIHLSFKNVTAKPFLVDPFPPELRVMRASPYDVPVYIFPAGTGSKSLNSGEVTDYNLVWDQLDNQGKPVDYGYYYLQLGYVRSEGGGNMTLWFTGKRLLILPAGGAMEKTVMVNQSQTVNGITITLERVELTATGMKVYAFNTPPGYKLPQGPNLAPPEFMILHAEAEYSIDSGVIKRAEPSGISFLQNGMRHVWNQDPVPRNANELTFRITKLGDWQGPWEFKVPLQ